MYDMFLQISAYLYEQSFILRQLIAPNNVTTNFFFQINMEGFAEDCEGLVIKTLYVPITFKLKTQKKLLF